MARYVGTMLKGPLGPHVLREVNGVQIASRRLAKGEMKQTRATKNVAKTFGMASKLGMHLRATVKDYLTKMYDPPMSLRMTNSLKDILIRCRDPKTRLYTFEEQSFSSLNGFDFNLKSPIDKSLLQNLTCKMADGILSVSFPASSTQDLLVFPDGSSACELNIGLSLFRLSEGLKKFAAEIQTLTISNSSATIDQQNFEFLVPDGCLCVVSVFLKYYTALRGLTPVVNSKIFSPAGICAALITPGAYENAVNSAWVRMPNLKFKLKKVTEI